MEGKKISFGFMKTKKAEKPVVQEKVEYIECVEEKAIKIVGGEPTIDNTPLIIPMKPNTLITAEKLMEIAVKVEKDLEEAEEIVPDQEDNRIIPENESLEQMAVRELIQDAKKEKKVETTALTVPIPSKPVLEGQKESTLEDYDSIPVQDFGMAMLRGMGWAPGKDQSKYKQPQLRPKGLGLGADKVIKENQKKNQKSKDEDLSIVKNAFVKITSGKYSGFYGKVVSLDEDNGRVMVDITVKKMTVSLSEFMMQPVTKSEFDKESKVINQDSYEEYKKTEGNSKASSSRQESSNRSEKILSSHSSSKLKDSRRDDKNGNKDKRRERSEDRSRETDDRKDISEDRSREEKCRKDKSEDRVRDRKRDYSEEKSKDRGERSEGRSKKRDDDRSREKQRDSSEDRPKRRDRKKYSSNESLSSSDSDKRKKKKNKHKYKRSDSDSSGYEKNRKEKRDIDKKRKGKKKKRDRDRSPNYKKHRK